MTICVSVSVAEGLVLAADSAVTLQGQVKTSGGTANGVLQQFNFANKVTRFKDYPIGIMSWGSASISDRSIQSLVMEFEHTYQSVEEWTKPFTVLDVAHDLLQFMKNRYNNAYTDTKQQPALGMFVGGYPQNEFFADAYTCEFPKKVGWSQVRPKTPDGRPSFGANWFGQTGPLLRLIKGYDPQGLSELIKRGADKAIVQKWVDDSISEFPLIFDGMPLQDAIDFASYATQVVTGAFRFGVGPPLCGGDVDIAVITPTTFRWAQRKQWAITE